MNNPTKDELQHDIAEAQAIVNSPEPLHENKNEDKAIRIIWKQVLNKLSIQLNRIERLSS